MTEELNQAAQQALACMRGLQQHLGPDICANEAAALERALTQRPAAQTEREDFEAWLRTKPEARLWNTTDAMLAAYQAGRASLPAPQQATPEPVGEVVYACPDELELMKQRTVKHCLLSTFPAHGGKDVALYTRPAPGVPDVDPLQGAANWFIAAIPDMTASEVAHRLTIGYNRASRLLAAAQAKGADK